MSTAAKTLTACRRTAWPAPTAAFFDADAGIEPVTVRNVSGFCAVGLWVGVLALYCTVELRWPAAIDDYRTRRRFIRSFVQ